ncbi:hypothetical protein SCACP_21270 [Sporomusa carbonis]|uniref:phage tail protein n=1 Tax=Sporomusa carbonis TaxID=3076075 RepID=UPI003A763543
MFGTFGPIIFDVSSEKVRTFDDFKRQTQAKFEEHAIINQKAKLEFISPGLDTISFRMVFSAFLGINPAAEIEQIRSVVQNGEYYPLVIGGKVLGNFVIESLSEAWTTIDNQGILLAAGVDVVLKEYYLDPVPGEKKEQVKKVETTKAEQTKTAVKSDLEKAVDKIKDTAAKINMAVTKVRIFANKVMSSIVKDLALAVRGLNNFLSTLADVKLGNLTSKQLKSLKILGMNPSDMAKAIKSSPVNAIVDVLKNVAKTDKALRNSAIGQLFGASMKGFVNQLAKNADQIEKAFKEVKEMKKSFDTKANELKRALA